MNKPNNKFKIGEWVLGEGGNTIFRISDIRVVGDSFGYSGDSIDGWWLEEDVIGFSVKKADLDEALAHLAVAKRNKLQNK